MNAEQDAQPIIGVLTETEIREGLTSGDVVIWPFEEEKLTPAGYDLTASDWVYSLNTHLLVPLHHQAGEKYCWIAPQETVLLLTREAVRLPRYIAGTLLPKASIAGLGFHCATLSLDTDWRGPILISLHNPTSHALKLPFASLEEGGRITEHTVVSLRLDLIRSFMGVSEARHGKQPSQLLNFIPSPFPRKFLRLNKKRELLTACLREVLQLDCLQGQSEVEFDAEVFKRQYDEARKVLAYYTDQAQKLSGELRARMRWGQRVKKNAFAALLLVALSYLGYQAWMFADYPLVTVGLLFLGLILLGKNFERI